MTSEWPQLDPITGRKICQSCWHGVHYHEMMRRKNFKGVMETYYERRDKLTPHATHACDGECDCVHRSEQAYAAIEQGKARENRRELRKNLKAQLEDPSNPLLAVNDNFKAPKGKTHA